VIKLLLEWFVSGPRCCTWCVLVEACSIWCGLHVPFAP